MKTLNELRQEKQNAEIEKNRLQKILDTNLNSFSYGSKEDFKSKIENLKNEIEKIDDVLNREDTAQEKMSDLLSEIKIADCENCDCEIFENDDLNTDYDLKLCGDCARNNFYRCADCEDVFNEKNDDVYYNDNQEKICEYCYSDNYFYCEKCEDVHKIDDAIIIDNSYYCGDCARNNFYQCEDCNTWLSEDNYFYCDDCDYYLCEDCHNNYHYHNTIQEFYPTQIDLKNSTYEMLKINRCFGVELEIAYDDIDYYSIENNTCFGSKEDCSINCGSELYSPILKGDTGYKEIEKLCAITENYYTDESTGFHLHIDCRDIKEDYTKLKKIMFFYHKIENIIFKIISPNRNDAQYTKKSKISINEILDCHSVSDLKEVYRVKNGSRYYGFNFEALNSHSTIELRYKEGNTKFKDIINWIKLNLYIFDYALNNPIEKLDRITSNINSLDRFITFLGIVSKRDYDLIGYWINQYNKYNSDNKVNV